MMKHCPKKHLSQNLTRLMEHKYGRENLNQLARDAKFGVATAQRMKDGETSVGLEMVEMAANVFGLHAWQLLCPGLDLANPPMVMTDDVTNRMWKAWRRLSDRKRRTVLASAEEYLAPDDENAPDGRMSRSA
jgi:hypothetical protein